MSSPFPDTSGNNVAVGSTHVYGNKVYKWNGSKWVGHSKFNNNIIGEYRDYISYTANTDAITVDVSKSNFVEIDVNQNSSILFADRVLEQNLVVKINNSSGYTINWPSGISWSTGTAPTISTNTLIELNKYNGLWHGRVLAENI